MKSLFTMAWNALFQLTLIYLSDVIFSQLVSELIVFPKISQQYSLRGITRIIYCIWNIVIFCRVHSFNKFKALLKSQLLSDYF